jgi:hypothetical protein
MNKERQTRIRLKTFMQSACTTILQTVIRDLRKKSDFESRVALQYACEELKQRINQGDHNGY